MCESLLREHDNDKQAFEPLYEVVCAPEVTLGANARSWPWFSCRCIEFYNGNRKDLSDAAMDKQGLAHTVLLFNLRGREERNRKVEKQKEKKGELLPFET